MRIAYLVGRYPTISHTFILREVAALRELGVEVSTISIWRSADREVLSAIDRAERERTVALMPLKVSRLLRSHAAVAARRPRGYIAALQAAFRLSRPGVRGRLLALTWLVEAAQVWWLCRSRGIDHIHAHLNGTAPAVASVTAALANAGLPRPECTWSFTVHGPTEFYDVHGEALAAKVIDASFVVAISDFARSQLMTLVDEQHWEKIKVVHCGVDPSRFAPPLVRPSPQGDGVSILNVGRITPVKGQALLLEALEVLKKRGHDVKVTFIGTGPRLEALRALAHTYGLSDDIIFAGAVGQDDILRYYAAADIFCLPSFAEGVPVVLMEAMAMSVPVVTTSVAGITELVEDYRSGIVVPPGRADVLTEAIEHLIREPDLRAEMGRRGRERVQTGFSISDSGASMAVLFKGSKGLT